VPLTPRGVIKKLRRSVETEKQKGKRPASENEDLTQYSTPTKRSRIGPQSHPAEDHRKDNQNKRREYTHQQTTIKKILLGFIRKLRLCSSRVILAFLGEAPNLAEVAVLCPIALGKGGWVVWQRLDNFKDSGSGVVAALVAAVASGGSSGGISGGK
jgi:hypothetical protein